MVVVESAWVDVLGRHFSGRRRFFTPALPMIPYASCFLSGLNNGTSLVMGNRGGHVDKAGLYQGV